MPRFDGTGPMGRGSRTGRGLGRCRPQVSGDAPDTNQQGFSQDPGVSQGFFGRLGRGFGIGRGKGFGMGRGQGRGFGPGGGRGR